MNIRNQRFWQANEPSRRHRRGNIHILEIDAREDRSSSLVGWPSIVGIVHGHQHCLIRLAQHSDVAEMDVLDVAPAASLCLEVDQKLYR